MQTQATGPNLIKLRSTDNISLKQIIESALSERLYNLEQGIKRTQERIKQFETQYQWSTEQFIQLFTNDQLQHSVDFDEWLGEAWMRDKIQQKIAIIQEIEFVD